MTKIRIHELAKNLGKTNKEVADFLKTKDIEVKSHMSAISEDAEEMVRKHFKRADDTGQEGTGKQKRQAEKETRPIEKKKKSNIIAVVRPQNARSQEARKKLQQREKAAKEKEAVEKAAVLKAEHEKERAAEETKERQRRQRLAKEAQEKVDAQAKAMQEAKIREEEQQRKKEQEAKDKEQAAASEDDRKQTPVDADKEIIADSTMEKALMNEKENQNVTRQRQENHHEQPRRNDRTQETGAPQHHTEGRTPGRSYTDRNQSRPYGERSGRTQGGRPEGSRPQGNRSENGGQNRPYGDRNRTQGTGQGQGRPYGDRNRTQGAGQGQSRPYGDRNRTQGAGAGQSRPYGDRNRTAGGPGAGRPYGDRNRTAGGPGGYNRDRKPAEPRDVGMQKPTRDTNHKVKDKTKDSMRGEKRFGDDKRPNANNRPRANRFSNVPKALKKPAPKPREEKKEVVTEITIPEKLTIRELAEKMKMQPAAVVKKLFMEGVMVTVNNEIDFEKAQEIALGFDIIAEQEVKVDVIEELLKEDEEDEKDMVARPPVVVVMGHVDHGKTSLLDAIRDTHVTDREAGGITQHIGATMVTINNQKITFLDTPGHEAFTAMRMRGANATDIAVLVVAADDGVMPQTIEAINHAKAAGVEIIVAVNKIDKPGANIERVKQELSEYELIPEDWGGSTIFVPVSAKTKEGIKELLEMILLSAEVLELKANPKRKARGIVLEARLDKGKGPVANILVQKGTLRIGDYIAAGSCSGKVRALNDEKGRRVKEAGPSTPVELLGLGDVPNAGEILVATDTDKEAKNFAATFVSEGKSKLIEDTKAKMSLDDLFSQIKEGNLKELNIVVKADVQGSVEAMKQSLVKLSGDEVVVKIVHGGVGAINESDVILAAASQAIIIGFNVRPDAQAKAIADQEGVDIRLYRVIYQAIEDVEAAMKGMLDPVYEEKVIGHAEIRQLFKASNVGTIAGSYVLDGAFQRGCKVRITREGKQIFEGELGSLKRFKDDVKEVKAGFECGLVFEGFNEEQELDIVEAYIMVEVPR